MRLQRLSLLLSSIQFTIYAFPSCIDDPAYRNPILSFLTCSAYAKASCENLKDLIGLNTEQADEARRRCPKSCDTCPFCNDDLLYKDPIYDRPCSFYAVSACTGLSDIGLNEAQTKDLFSNCPKACRQCEADKKCEDDLDYHDKFEKGCGTYKGLKCADMKHMGLSIIEVAELMERCPVTCEVCARESDPIPSFRSKGGSPTLLSFTSIPFVFFEKNTYAAITRPNCGWFELP